MAAAFERILQISQSGSVIVLAVLALRLILRNAPRRAVCLLWMLAVLRLLVPFEIESDWSLQPEPVEFAPPAQVEFFDSGTAPAPVPPEFLEDAVEYPLQQPPVPEQKAEPLDLLPWVWLVGVALLAAHGIVSFWRLKRRVRDSIILEEGVWVCHGLDTAFVLGFFRPRVYLPVLDAQERELVLLHERQHIRRGDHWWKLAAYAAVSLHWFNPLAWVTYFLMCRDMELACDQETVKGMDNARRKAYSAALLNCAAKRSGIAACPVAFGEISVKERIKMVLNYKKPGFWVTVIALIAAVAVGFFLLTSPKTDLQRCERALERWQKMDAYKFRETQANSGDGALNDFYMSTYWSVDGVHLKGFSFGESLEHWNQWKDGEGYAYESGSEDAEWVDEGWVKVELQEEETIPWVMKLDLDALSVRHVEAAEDGKTVLVTAEHPSLGTINLTFCFDKDGALWSISRSFTSHFTVNGDETVSVVASSIVALEETDRGKIQAEMDRFGVKPELLQLYRQLEALQNAENVHLLIDMELDSDYPGWETCRQEFIRTDTGDRFYRNFDYQSAAGSYTTTYLKYGNAVYAREYSEAGVVPDREWERIQDRGFGELPLLNLDWTRFEVLQIAKQGNGSTVITLQGDLSPTADTTYYAKTYEFHLDPNGKLVEQIVNYHTRKNISDGFAQGTFELRGRDTVHILATPQEKLTEQILATAKELLDYTVADQKSGS